MSCIHTLSLFLFPFLQEEGTTHSERQASRLAKPALIDVKGGNIPNCGSPKQKRIEDRQRGPICRPKSGSRTTRGASYSFLNMENNSEAFTEHARTENRHESVTEQKFFDFQEQVISAVQDVCSSNDEIQQSWKTHRENSDTRIREFDTNLRNRIEEVCLNFKKTFSAQEAAWSAKLAEGGEKSAVAPVFFILFFGKCIRIFTGFLFLMF